VAARKLSDSEIARLRDKNPEGSGAIAVRKTLLAHRAKGGALDPNDVAMLLATYLRWDKRGWPGALRDKKHDPTHVAIVDELLAEIRGPGGKKFIGGLGSLTSKRRASLGILSQLAVNLVALGRLADAMEMFEVYRAAQRGMTVIHAVLYVRAAVRFGSRDALAKALKAFEKEAEEGFAFAKEMAKHRAALKRMKGTSKPAAPMSPIQTVIDALGRTNTATGYDGTKYRSPKPLAPALRSKLALPGGEPVPPSLSTWLGFDASWFPLFDKSRKWNAVPLSKLEPAANPLPRGVKPTTLVIELPESASQRHALVVSGKPDMHGELPVLGYEKEEYWIKYPSWAAFIADYFGIDV
jgi:hypothetical protein